MTDLNDSQKKIALENLEGMVVVDAGPGTGKTSTIVSRYCNILCKDVRPADVILLTFTRNAAAEMEERTKAKLAEIGRPDISGELRTSTFDSFCFSVVMESPESVSRFFDLKERLTRSASIVENETLNQTYFADFMDRFLADRGEDYGERSVIASQNYGDLYKLISRLMSRGVMPLRSGWFTGGEDDIVTGNPDALFEILQAKRQIIEGKEKKYFALSKTMNEWCVENQIDSLFNNDEEISDELILAAVNYRRSDLFKLVHDVYYEFIRRSVTDDRLTFGLVSIFAFVTLYSDKGVRERMSCRYLMIDEFQDTNRSQLAIALMLLKEPNLCVVGDWKQGIYGFRYVSTENITDFENRSRSLVGWLNEDERRVPFSVGDVISLPLDVNYRSSQEIIDCAFRGLYIQGSTTEILDKGDLKQKIVNITAGRTDIGNDTRIEYICAADKQDEVKEVLRRIQNYVSSGKYVIHERDGTSRAPAYGDIAVLCRTTNLARVIYQEAAAYGIPAFLQGDVDIMSSREGKLLLAWLKYVNNPFDPWGLPTILADQNYPLCDIREMLDAEGELKVPGEIIGLRLEIIRMKRITSKISAIFDYYKLNNDITQTLISMISSSHRGSLLTISDVIRMIETDIDNETTYPVDSSLDRKAVILQTMHKSKGLEYPIVIVAGVNQGSFPNTRGETSAYRFSDNMGIRCTQEIRHFGDGFTDIVGSWKTKLVSATVEKDYDEERRLLFVALSRAEQYITVTASNPSSFFLELSGEVTQPCLSDKLLDIAITRSEEALSKRPETDPFKPRRKNIAVRDILSFDGEEIPAEDCDEFCGKGMEYGTKVHQAAEAMARGIPVERDYPEIPAIRAVLDSVKGAHIMPEKECSLPFNDIGASLRGVIDLLAVFPDRVEIHDYKTDVNRRFEREYRLQLSIYAHAASEYFGKPAVCVIDYVSMGQRQEFAPLGREVIAARVAEYLAM
ncbi:MAG: UvrD-helicase domain-containing protein [Candidatus Methanomethylophilaceae archaeon]|nr:UvrD-helicase domain-containing protein [Candidatus Methanomethylophilaceae archaeon]